MTYTFDNDLITAPSRQRCYCQITQTHQHRTCWGVHSAPPNTHEYNYNVIEFITKSYSVLRWIKLDLKLIKDKRCVIQARNLATVLSNVKEIDLVNSASHCISYCLYYLKSSIFGQQYPHDCFDIHIRRTFILVLYVNMKWYILGYIRSTMARYSIANCYYHSYTLGDFNHQDCFNIWPYQTTVAASTHPSLDVLRIFLSGFSVTTHNSINCNR